MEKERDSQVSREYQKVGADVTLFGPFFLSRRKLPGYIAVYTHNPSVPALKFFFFPIVCVTWNDTSGARELSFYVATKILR